MTHKTLLIATALTNSLIYGMDSTDNPSGQQQSARNPQRVQETLLRAIQAARAHGHREATGTIPEEDVTVYQELGASIRCPTFVIRSLWVEGIHVPLHVPRECTFTFPTAQINSEYHH